MKIRILFCIKSSNANLSRGIMLFLIELNEYTNAMINGKMNTKAVPQKVH